MSVLDTAKQVFLSIFNPAGLMQSQVNIRYASPNSTAFTDVTGNLGPHFIGLKYSDCISFKADNLDVTLEDSARELIGPQGIEAGGSLWIQLIKLNDRYPGEQVQMNLGRFEISRIEFNVPPSVVVLKATSVPVSGSLKITKKSKAWEGTALKNIAQAIAAESNLKLDYQTKENPGYKRIDQTDESDLQFLSKLCQEEGLSLKVLDNSLIIFDEYDYEQKPAQDTITYGVTEYHSFRLAREMQDTVKGATSAYHNPLTGKTTQGQFMHKDSFFDVPTQEMAKDTANNHPETDETEEDFEDALEASGD